MVLEYGTACMQTPFGDSGFIRALPKMHIIFTSFSYCKMMKFLLKYDNGKREKPSKNEHSG